MGWNARSRRGFSLPTVVALLVAVVAYRQFIVPTETPAPAPMERTGSGIQSYEFDDLLKQRTSFQRLSKSGFYTVVVGCLDSCAVCKRLEGDFPEFLAARKDVLIRRVRFNESNSLTWSSQSEMDNYLQLLGSYNSHYVAKDSGNIGISTCGTPHVEIYGPDGEVVATDLCSETNDKSGTEYLRRWIEEETS
jgi:hypothetical protein